LKENYDVNFHYLWDRFQKSSDIAWEQGEKFWFNRLSFLLSLNDKKIKKSIEQYLKNRMFSLIKVKLNIHTKYDVEYLQFLELCKIKKLKKENLAFVRNHLIESVGNLNITKLMNIVNSFIPIVYNDINDFCNAVSKKITQSTHHFDLLLELEKEGVSLNREVIVDLAYKIITSEKYSDKICNTFFALINDSIIRNLLKEKYTSLNQKSLLNLIRYCEYYLIEENHLRNIKNVLDLDPKIVDDLLSIYADKVYYRGNNGHKRANVDKLIKLLKNIPQMTPKKILVYLSSHNKISDIKYMLSEFPELKTLAAFV
jgi:hypothetical protein